MGRVGKWIAVAALFLFICIKGSAVFLYLNEYRQADLAYKKLGMLAGEKRTAGRLTAEDPAQNEGEKGSAAALDCPVEPDFTALKALNPDTVGWLCLPGTRIDYPVVQGKDNTYYLDHMLDGSKNRSGCIFADCDARADFMSPHTVLYGHHMKNGSMFAVLSKYRSQEWYEAHPTLWLVTPEEVLYLRVYSVYTADVTDDAWQIEFTDQEEYRTWLAETERRSEIVTEILPEETGNVITLSTCSYEFENARLVVHATVQERWKRNFAA